MSKKNQTALDQVNETNNLNLAPVEKKTIEHDYAVLLETYKTKSGMVRFLSAEGFDRGTIAKYMGIRYQHVRNILVTPIKKSA